MKLETMAPAEGARTSSKRLGRGMGRMKIFYNKVFKNYFLLVCCLFLLEVFFKLFNGISLFYGLKVSDIANEIKMIFNLKPSCHQVKEYL